MRSAISSGSNSELIPALDRKLIHSLVKGHVVGGSAFLHIGPATVCQDRAWNHAVDLYAIFDASLGEGARALAMIAALIVDTAA